MGKIKGSDWLAAAAGAIPVIGSVISNAITARSERREYDKMREYNTPANQMKRFTDAGLSPYLIYGQGNPGNVSSPRPPERAPLENIGEGIEKYIGMVNLQNSLTQLEMQKRMFPLEYNIRRNDSLAADNMLTITNEKALQERYKSMKQGMDLAISYDYEGDFKKGLFKHTLAGQQQEFKRALSEANVERMKQTVDMLRYRNQVEKVKGKYATDFGMVGGDWTQGMGLLRSLPSLFKGARKIPANEKALIDTYRKFKGDQHKRDANRFLFEQLK